jgi:hypothetical protein
MVLCQVLHHINLILAVTKFQANLHKYHDVLNVRDYFTIEIKNEQCSLQTNLKF